jgi:signal transduction histidine kinase
MEINQGQERSDYDEAILKKEAEELLSFNDKIIGLSAYSNSKSTVLSYAATFETLWKEAELHEQVRESNKHLEAANQELESTNRQLALANEHMKVNDEIQKDFINVAAHELRTPTQSILGYAQMLCMEPERGRQYLSPILRNAERLQRLTGDILDVTKKRVGR